MKIDELLDLTLKDILINYSAVMSLECGYYYGIASNDDLDEAFEKYNLTDENEDNLSFCAESIINEELLYGHDDVLDYTKLEKILDYLGIPKKE